MEIGISTFVETTPDENGEHISHAQRINEVIEEMKLADKLGLDVYGIGEHHRKDFAASAPHIILAAAATVTKNIRLASAVTVLSSEDPIRVYQEYATIDAISGGRAEIMAGRGSFTESFPLFGYDLRHYDILFEEKLDLLLNVQQNEIVSWKGQHRQELKATGIYPRAVQDKLPVWIGTGGNTESTIRAASLGLPIVYAIIGGRPIAFKPLVDLYKQVYLQEGHDISGMKIASHSHGFIAKTDEEAQEKFYEPTRKVMSQLGKERGWGPYTKDVYNAALSPDGALFVGSPQTVADKIISLHKNVGITRFFLHLPLGTMPHSDVMKAIELLGSEVAPRVRAEVRA